MYNQLNLLGRRDTACRVRTIETFSIGIFEWKNIMYHIEQEIAEQPEVIQRLISEEAEHTAQIAAAIREFNPAFVMIAARGTSDNAARYAEYLLGIVAKLPVALA